MPSELSISAVQALTGQNETHGDAKTAPATPVPAERRATPAQPFVNPSLRLDAALGLVVIEFRDDAGALTSTIPSQRQIQAYRMHQDALPQQAIATPTATASATPATPPPAPPAAAEAQRPAAMAQAPPPASGATAPPDADASHPAEPRKG